LKIGPVSAKFTGKVSLMDIVPPNSYALQFEAQGGVAGFGKGTSKVLLTPMPEGCELSYTVNSQVGGKIAQLGQRLIDGAAKSLAEDFFQRFENELLKLYPASQNTATAPVSEEKTRSGMPEWVWLLGAAVIAVGIWFIKH
ncbi:MAG: carbon monoxide dehydrogenase, partial [Limnohabitans sp.]|nr:carbon monoxide dehydrogenase [Limnohabitans sp.]